MPANDCEKLSSCPARAVTAAKAVAGDRDEAAVAAGSGNAEPLSWPLIMKYMNFVDNNHSGLAGIIMGATIMMQLGAGESLLRPWNLKRPQSFNVEYITPL